MVEAKRQGMEKLAKIEPKKVRVLQPCVPGNKLTQKDNANSGVQFITPAGQMQSLLLAKDSNQFF